MRRIPRTSDGLIVPFGPLSFSLRLSSGARTTVPARLKPLLTAPVGCSGSSATRLIILLYCDIRVLTCFAWSSLAVEK